ncbi:MAG: hypothetical protein ABGY41_10560 [Candidatus Poribacteria bacterium]
MIPPSDPNGNLPPGIHLANWSEFTARYGTTPHREGLIGGLERALDALQSASCTKVYVDGSFVTAKESPGDYDVAWEPTNVDVAGLLASETVFGDFSHGCALQKAKYGGEFFPSSFREALTGSTFLDFFHKDRDTGGRKGIVALDL